MDTPIEAQIVPISLFEDLVRYTKYSSGAYLPTCPSPLGNTSVKQFNVSATNTHGYIARDDDRQEIVITFRGSFQLNDFYTDSLVILRPLDIPGVSDPGNAKAHTGFLISFNSVASEIISTVRDQLVAHPEYTLVATGHSLGGALASLASVSLKSTFSNSTVRLYTFGQPRTGNADYAALVDNIIGLSHTFRAVHTFGNISVHFKATDLRLSEIDGVPTVIPQLWGYQHHGTEYWNFLDPATPLTVKRGSHDEDPLCSASIPSTGINVAHTIYFGQVIAADPGVCQHS